MGRTVKRWGPKGAPKLRVTEVKTPNEPERRGGVLHQRMYPAHDPGQCSTHDIGRSSFTREEAVNSLPSYSTDQGSAFPILSGVFPLPLVSG